MLSKKISQLKPSPTLALAAKAKALKAEGHDVISLTVGEPDWPSYDSAKQAGIDAINDNKTTYTPASGIPQLKKAVAKLIGSQLNLEYQPQEVTIGSGAKFILYTAFYALLDAGEEVIIPSPYWVSYPTMVELAGGVPKVVHCGEENSFKLTAAQLKSAITPETKILLLNSPSNPTGSEYTKAELKEICSVIEENPQLVVVSDDIYNQLSFNETGLSPHVLHLSPGLKERVISVNGMSKAYSMTGWRMGWAVGPEAVIKAMASFQSQTTGAPSSISQWASLAAIEKGVADVKQSLVALKERRHFFLESIEQVPMVKPFAPQGAFYLWLNVQEWLGKSYKSQKLKDTRDVAQSLLDDLKLAVVPGIEFGMDGFLRLSFAASQKDLQEAIERMKTFAGQLS